MVENNNHINYIKFVNKMKILINVNKNLDYWGLIFINPETLSKLYNIHKEGYKFLDLGCGVGNVLRYASNIGYEVTGVEFNGEYEEYLKEYDYLIEDIRDLSNDFYSKFDIIYSYKPLKSELNDYINMVIENMRVDTYIFTPDFIIKNDRIKKIDNNLYKKIK